MQQNMSARSYDDCTYLGPSAEVAVRAEAQGAAEGQGLGQTEALGVVSLQVGLAGLVKLPVHVQLVLVPWRQQVRVHWVLGPSASTRNDVAVVKNTF